MSITVQQPAPFDLVGKVVRVAGLATGFEATVNYRVHEGHDEVSGFFNVGGGTGEHAQFQIEVDVSGAAFARDRLFVEVFEVSPRDGSEIHKVVVPVLYGNRIVRGYVGYREHLVVPGDTLAAIAEDHYGDPSRYRRIVRANDHIIDDPDLIFPGQVLRLPIGRR